MSRFEQVEFFDLFTLFTKSSFSNSIPYLGFSVDFKWLSLQWEFMAADII